MACNNEPGPVTCNKYGHPTCKRRKDLVRMMASEVKHPDKFNPTVKWKLHKKEGRVMAMFKQFQEDWSIPDNSWKWFNKTANKRWSDHINKTLKAYYTAAKGDFVKAISYHPLGLINEETWLALCVHFRAISTPDPVSGKSKSTICSTSRKKNKLNYGFGRTSIASWSSSYTAKYNIEPNVVHVFDKGYLHIDALKAGEDPTSQNPTGLCDDPEIRVLSEKLHKGVEDFMKEGIESSIASSRTVFDIFGKPKLGVLLHRQMKRQSSHKQTNASLEQTVGGIPGNY